MSEHASDNPQQNQRPYDDDEEQYEPPGGDRGGSAPDQSAPDEEETLIWRGKPAQIVNIKPFVICVANCIGIVVLALIIGNFIEARYGQMFLVLLIIPLAYMFWRYLVTRYRRYEITTERLREQVGVLHRRTHEMELYRVRDSHISEPLLYRIIGVGNVVMDTSDRSHPQFTLWAIREPHEVRNHIRERVEVLRAKKRVREVDFE